MPKPPMTRPGTRKLSDTARHLVLPTGIVSTGWPEIRNQCRALGIAFEPWQDGLGMAAFGKREDGTYAASIGGVVMSIPRQVGKTFLVGAIAFALCLVKPGTKVIWSAHHGDTASETFESMREMSQRSKIRPHILRITTGGNAYKIFFRNRSRIEFGSREHGFGRGKQKVGLLVLDEAQIMSESALENQVPAMNRADNPLMFMMGTPPRPIDNGEMFTNKRARAIEGRSTDTLYVELSADKDADLDDEAQWRKANPSYPEFTPKTAMLRMRETFGDGGFRREALGIWDEDAGAAKRLIPADAWAETAVDRAPEGVRSLAITFDLDGSRQAVAGAVKHDDGVHVELIGAHSGSADLGLRSLVEWLTSDPDRPDRWRSLALIAIAGGGEAGTLAKALTDAGVPKQMIHVMKTPEVLAANAMLLDAVRDRSLTHPAAPEGDPLDASVAVCDQKTRVGGWSWKPTVPDGDQLPIEVASMALWAAKTTRRRPVGERRSTSRGRGTGRGRPAGRR